MSGTTPTTRGERSVATEADRGRLLPFAQAGGAKPIAVSAAMRRGGGLEGFTPPHRFKARTAASDGHKASTRAARQRRAQVCGDSTVQSGGRWAGSPHPPQAVPLPLRGEGLNARESGLACEYRAIRQRFARRIVEILIQLCYPVSGLWSLYNKAPDNGNQNSIIRRSVLPLEGKGDRFAVDELYPQK